MDGYITVCDKLESSQSEFERNNYETLIQQIINGVKAGCEKHGTKKGADATAIITVRKEVDKIRAFCRENRKMEAIYEQCKAELEVLNHKKEKDESFLQQNTENERLTEIVQIKKQKNGRYYIYTP